MTDLPINDPKINEAEERAKRAELLARSAAIANIDPAFFMLASIFDVLSRIESHLVVSLQMSMNAEQNRRNIADPVSTLSSILDKVSTDDKSTTEQPTGEE